MFSIMEFRSFVILHKPNKTCVAKCSISSNNQPQPNMSSLINISNYFCCHISLYESKI